MAERWTAEQQKAVEKERNYWLEKFFLGRWHGEYVILQNVEIEEEEGHSAIKLTFLDEDDEKVKAIYIGKLTLDQLSELIGKKTRAFVKMPDKTAINYLDIGDRFWS